MIGFDNAHGCDVTFNQILPMYQGMEPFGVFGRDATFKSIDYVVEQCKKCIDTIMDK
jgi:hypothetical protein